MEQTYSSRRDFLVGAALGAAELAAASAGISRCLAADLPSPSGIRPPYRGPAVIIIRFGGGVRRRETIEEQTTYSPFFCHELTRRGTLFRNTEIASLEGVETSHGQGTLSLLTGKYDRDQDVEGRFLGARFESKVPTLFEYLRKEYSIPEHQTLIINGEDRIDEEFYSFSNHHLFGVHYR